MTVSGIHKGKFLNEVCQLMAGKTVQTCIYCRLHSDCIHIIWYAGADLWIIMVLLKLMTLKYYHVHHRS